MSISLLALAAVGWADPPADGGLKPVTVAVVDRATGEPVTPFSYKFDYESVGRDDVDAERGWTPVESPAGTVVLQAPASCRLWVEAKGRDHLAGWEEVDFRPTDATRRVVLRLSRGITVRGTVRDAATKAPIAGAKVASGSRTDEGRMRGDFDWAVTTDAGGRYEQHGVDPEGGMAVTHPDYRAAWPYDELVQGKAEHDVALARLRRIRGVVRDRDGKPIAGVKVGVYLSMQRERARTLSDGSFDLADPEYDSSLEFCEEAHISRELKRDDFLRDGLVVVMEPKFAVEGRVSTPDGRPVPSFRVEIGPGPKPSGYDHDARTIDDPAGQFTLRLGHSGRSYVTVRAEGYALWEGWAEVARGSGPLAIRLDRGAVVSGQIAAPSRGGTPIRAILKPRYEKGDYRNNTVDPKAEMIGTIETAVAPDGTVRFDHVRPDRYTLRLEGPKVTGREFALDVPAEGLDLGTIRLAGRGRIVGRVHWPATVGVGPWTFADGGVIAPSVEWPLGLGFKADEDGRFRVEDVPAEVVAVSFSHITPGCCVIDQYSQQARVVEGRTTEVIAFDQKAARPLPIVLDVGDGSGAQFVAGSGRGGKRIEEVIASFRDGTFERDSNLFGVELVPRSPWPLSFFEPRWQGADPERGLVVPDVGPGDYRLRLLDWPGEEKLYRVRVDAVLAEQDITVPPGSPIRIRLGAGCIKGKGPPSDGHQPQIAIATPRDGKGPARRTPCDSEGNFCLRFLPPGRYTVRIRDPESGWARVDDVPVLVGTTDLGAIRTKPGGTIAGTTTFRRPSPVPDEIVATDDAGVELTARVDHLTSFDRFDLPGLWPGRWTVAVRSDGATVARGEITLWGTETARVDLATAAGNGP